MAKIVFDDHKDLMIDLPSDFHVEYGGKGLTRINNTKENTVALFIRRYPNADLRTISDFQYQLENNKNNSIRRQSRKVDLFLGCKPLAEVWLSRDEEGKLFEYRIYFLKKNNIVYLFWLYSLNDEYVSARKLVDLLKWTGKFENPPMRCSECAGEGAYEGKCNQCNGIGLLPRPFGPRPYSMNPNNMVPCFQCNMKKVVMYRCSVCDGEKFTFNTKPGTSKR